MATKPKRGRNRFRRAKKKRLGLWTGIAVAFLLFAYVAVLESSRPHVTGERLRLDELATLARQDRLRQVEILDVDSYAVGTYTNDDRRVVRFNAPYLKDGRERLVDILLENNVPTTVNQQSGKRLISLGGVMLPGLILIILFAYLIISSRRGSGLFAIRSGAQQFRADDVGVRFADVAGQDQAIAELREVKEFLADPEPFTALGATVPKGVLLYGPPGAGKTMLARALAAEAGASFFSVAGSDFVELYVGVGASRVRDLFRQARENAPALVFIDELDAIGRARSVGGAVSSNTEQDQALNQILVEMDGFTPSEGIVVVGATNRPDTLDPALLRPGRFDRSIGLEKPDEAARRAILAVHAKNKSLAPDVDLDTIARQAIGLSGADLASVMNEGALLTARVGKTAISQAELDQALHRILEAPERQRRLSQRQRSIGRRYTGDDRATFADVAGQEHAVAELREVREFLTDPERFAALGAVAPKGVLLYGPPGSGKTLMARALAGEANAAFFAVGASEFVETFVGVGASRIRDLFAEARSMAPAIVFIDEIDSVGRSRAGGGAGTSHQGADAEQSHALTQLLEEMDGFSASEGVLVIAATNRPDTLDPALLRPGRFDRAIGLERPDEAGRLAILSYHARGKVLAADTDLGPIARRAVGLAGAELATVMNEAAILAVRAGKAAISQAELIAAVEKVLRVPADQARLAMRARSIGRRAGPDERVTFADVAGAGDAIEELVEVRDYLAVPERFARVGARVPRGILLSGPPGCGKTLLAKAVAGEANAAFFSVAGSEFVEVLVGQGAARVRDLFGEAASTAPAIVFIDEIDAVGQRRSEGGWGGGHREQEQTLNQILVEMDGFEPNGGVIVMAATNRPDLLDPALVRPGRFDRHVSIALPDRSGRAEILALHARGVPLADDVDLDKLAGLTPGFSGADLANVVNEAALLAARRSSADIAMELMEEGVDRAVLGLASRTPLLSDHERRVVAYHESGHALVAMAIPDVAPPHKLTLVPRGRSLGHCAMLEGREPALLFGATLRGELAVLLGGMVAEQLVYGEASSGPAGDLRRAAEIAYRMVREFGMSAELGPFTVPDGAGANGWSRASYSEASAQAVDAEVRRLLEEASSAAREVLTGARRQLDTVAQALLERETLTATDLASLAPKTGTARRRRTG